MPIFNFNHRNADGGNFNCVFVSCGYLLNIDKSDVARHGKIAEPQSGGLQWSDVEKLAKNLADYMHVGYKYAYSVPSPAESYVHVSCY